MGSANTAAIEARMTAGSVASSAYAAGMAGAAYRSCAVEDCQCTKTGVSGGVKIEAIGCADHFKEDKIPWCDGCRCLGLP
jgi:hypothetical protein